MAIDRTEHEIVIAEGIESRILMIRGQRVILDADLAKLYGVPTKRLILLFFPLSKVVAESLHLFMET